MRPAIPLYKLFATAVPTWYTDATVGQNTQNFEHVYAGKRHVGSREVTGQPVNGKVWRWEGGAGAVDHAPIEAPQWSSASGGNYFQVNDERNMSRRAYAANMAAGDTTEQTRYSDWYYVNGGLVPARPALGAAKSELFTAYAITLDADRCSTPYTNHALNLAQTDLEFEVTRVKSPVLGRDLNPMGRGDGTYYCNGGNYALSASLAIRGAMPRSVGERAFGFGNDVNNQCGSPGPSYPLLVQKYQPRPPIYLPPDPDDPYTWWRLVGRKLPNDPNARLHYEADIEDWCVGAVGGVVERVSGLQWNYCQDKCLDRAAIAFAGLIMQLCTNYRGERECMVYAAGLPETLSQAKHGPNDYWGVVMDINCNREVSSPLMVCICARANPNIGAADVQGCLTELMRGPVDRCQTGSIAVKPDDPASDECAEECGGYRSKHPCSIISSRHFCECYEVCYDDCIQDLNDPSDRMKEIVACCKRYWSQEQWE